MKGFEQKERGQERENNLQISFFLCSDQSSSSCIFSVSSKTERALDWKVGDMRSSSALFAVCLKHCICIQTRAVLDLCEYLLFICNRVSLGAYSGLGKELGTKKMKEKKSTVSSFSLSLYWICGYRHTNVKSGNKSRPPGPQHSTRSYGNFF